jgi:amidase
MLSLAHILDGEGYMRAIAQRTRLIRAWLAFLEDWPIILAPVSVQPTPRINTDLAGEAALRRLFLNDFRFISAINVLGLPSAVTPIGLARGLPVGAQLIASRYREDLCLDAAAAIEARVGVMARTLWTREGG